jgi:opacity protein-like surface antigen
MKNSLIIALLVCMAFASRSAAQSDMDLLDDKEDTSPVLATFKSTRLINFHTIEVPGKRSLDFRIAHRFDELNKGIYNMWGLDGGANIRLSLQYSWDGRLAFEMGRAGKEKNYDAQVKYRLLRQTTNHSMPVSLTLVGGMYYDFTKNPLLPSNKAYRLSYVTQVILGRKFSERFSFQVAPVWIHFNLTDSIGDNNDAFTLAACMRYKFTKRMALTAEYGYRLVKNFANNSYYDPFGIGLDIETGGHVFQVHITNAMFMQEHLYFSRTTTTFKDWGIRLGFNVSRLFAI